MNTRIILIVLLFCLVKNPVHAVERHITMDEYEDKMKAGWVGQMAGVALGAPTEFKFKGNLIPEDKVPQWNPEMINQFQQDDIYVEMTFIQTLDDYGFDVSIRQAGIDFANSGYQLWHANKCGRDNLRNGIAPPDSGHPRFNKCADDIDYQIESDFSGLIAPGMPQIAVELGDKFGRLMNYGDGFYAGQFVGAMYSEAFFEKDVQKIIRKALKSIPAESQYAEMVRDILQWHTDKPEDWQYSWKKIESKYHSDPAYTHGKCSKPGGPGQFSIDAKLNGAYILMGLLYGDGDIEKTIVVSMRCGQDSDCNPSNAAGILCTSMGLKSLPVKYTSALNMQGKFSHTRYDFPSLIAVSKKLVRQAVVRSGGRLEHNTDGKEVLVIPVKEVVTSKFIQTFNPGPVADSHFIEDEMTKICCIGKSMALDVEKFAPGWKIKDCGPDMEPGLRDELRGRKNVLLTHPLNRQQACVLSKTVKVQEEGRIFLVLDVGHDVRGDWDLVVKADGKELASKTIGKNYCVDGWTRVMVDLSAFAGKTIKLELLNKPNGWQWEAGLWSSISIEKR